LFLSLFRRWFPRIIIFIVALLSHFSVRKVVVDTSHLSTDEFGMEMCRQKDTLRFGLLLSDHYLGLRC